MSERELHTILDAVRHAKDTMISLGNYEYPDGDWLRAWKDPALKDMFYTLNDMCLALAEKRGE